MLHTISLFLLVARVSCLNFAWEREQLSAAEAASNTAIAFDSGVTDTEAPTPRDEASRDVCKVIPGDANWPSEEDWAAFNETLGGVLLKPKPLSSPCYAGDGYDKAVCEQLKSGWAGKSMHADDPTSIHSQWASGNTCIPTSQPNSTTCTQGGYPVYVVRATTTRHIQLAVNFARNARIRLVVKNSGHDFNGKSIGGHALSIWTHNLKSLTYHANYTAPGGNYTGRAVAYAAGTQAFEGSALMRRENMTFLVAGGGTVGIAGGFLQGGGHSSFTSYYGLAADHVLAITAVTADGRVVEAHAGVNEDLFWAFRGGGGGTYGIITSVVVRAFPNTPLVSSSIRFSTTPPPGSSNASTISNETFWAGMKAYWEFGTAICDAGGLGYNFIYPQNTPTGLTFTVSISLPGRSLAEYRAFIRPLVEKLSAVGISLPALNLKRSSLSPSFTDSPSPHPHPSRPLSPRALGETTGHTLIASRLFPRSSFSTPAALNASHTAIRHLVEHGGLTFHGMNYAPSLAVAGHPRNAVNPAFRTTVLHAQGYEPTAHWDGFAPVVAREALSARHARLQGYMQVWRDVSVGGGSYINEGDAQDWAWKEAFFGHNYARLLGVKRKWDPRSVFWAVGAVGSDEWEIRDVDGEVREGLVVQDGRLCMARG